MNDNVTPAQAAKDYAREHGFIISAIPALRRYGVKVLRDGVAGEQIAEVGGYPAALNAMKRNVEYMQASDDAAFAIQSGAQLDATADAYSLRKRNEGETDAAYRVFLTTAICGLPDKPVEFITKPIRDVIAPALDSIDRSNMGQRAQHIRHWYVVCADGTIEGIYSNQTDAVRHARRLYSGAHGKTFARTLGLRVEYRA